MPAPMLRMVTGCPMAAEIWAANAIRTVSVAKMDRAQKKPTADNRSTRTATPTAIFLSTALTPSRILLQALRLSARFGGGTHEPRLSRFALG